MNGQSKYTVWHYVGCGCAVLFVLAVLGIGGCFFVLRDWGRQMEAEIKDPEARAAKARSILGFEELPPGYHPGISFSVPFVMEVVLLGDRELPAGDEMENLDGEDDFFDERGFIYFKIRFIGDANTEVDKDIDYDFDAEERVAEGEVEAGRATVRYRTDLGTSHVGGDRLRTLSADLEIQCGDGYKRHGIWFTPIPEEGSGYAGTPGDEASLREFLDHFRFCG